MVSFGWSLSTSLRLTAKPAPSRAEFALSNVEPITLGTMTGCGPFDTLSLIAEPSSTEAPDFAVWLITWFSGASLSTWQILHFRFAAHRSDIAWSSGSPTTLGTFVCGGPADEKIVT